MLLALHISAAIWALVTGTIQLMARKGTVKHKFIGHSWMLAMVIVAVSSFGIREFTPVIGPFSLIHLLSIWVLICVAVSIYFARVGNIKRHKGFAKGAFFGLVGAGIGALAPGRLIHEWLFFKNHYNDCAYLLFWLLIWFMRFYLRALSKSRN